MTTEIVKADENLDKKFEGIAKNAVLELILRKIIEIINPEELLKMIDPMLQMVEKKLGKDNKRFMLQIEPDTKKICLLEIETDGIIAMEFDRNKVKIHNITEKKNELMNSNIEELLTNLQTQLSNS